jgi:hypothetical protein
MLLHSLQSLARALGGEVSGNQVRAPGPGHSTKDRSMTVKPADNVDGFIVYAHSLQNSWQECKDYVRSKIGAEPFDTSKPAKDPRPTVEQTYDYQDESGAVLFQVQRFKPKTFRQRHPDGLGGYVPNMDGVRRVLYRLPELIEAIANEQPVFIAEGEKAVDKLMAAGVTATCSPMGAGKWRDEYAAYLKGANVIVLPDNDKAGEEHAAAVMRSIAGVASSSRLLRLPGLPDKGDAHDWFQVGGTVEKLWELVDQAPEPAADSEPEGSEAVLSLHDWLERDIPPLDLICGSFIHTTCRILVTAPTGLGKTMLGLAMAIRNGAGKDFLHWKAGRPARVLYVDGEMSRGEMQRRLRGEVRRSGLKPETLSILSREDFEDMPPLNTPDGQQWMDGKIELIRPELIYLDNIQALLTGEHAKEESWQPILPWMWSLTRRHIGQLWCHHTGHAEDHAFGTKTREWQMDTCALLERVNENEDALAFAIKFTKARGRTPDTRADYRDVIITLAGDAWSLGDAPKVTNKLSNTQKLAYDALVSFAADKGSPLPADLGLPAGLMAVAGTAFKDELLARNVIKADAKNPHSRFNELCDALKVRSLAGERNGRIWPIIKATR